MGGMTTIRYDPMQVGALSRVIKTRRGMRIGKQYRLGRYGHHGAIIWTAMTLVEKRSRYARFRVDGVLGSYFTCYGWFELMTALGDGEEGVL